MKNLTLLVLFVSILSGMDEKEIELENNQYQMENVCSTPNSISNKWKSFNRGYKFTFKSQYNVFEKYKDYDKDYYDISLKTNLYTIEPSYVEAKNKKTIEILLYEDDMKKLYESYSVKVFFDEKIFNYDYTHVHKDYKYGSITISYQPVISIKLNIDDFMKEQAKCTEKENEYNKEYEEYHSKPLNRIKTFFDL